MYSAAVLVYPGGAEGSAGCVGGVAGVVPRGGGVSGIPGHNAAMKVLSSRT